MTGPPSSERAKGRADAVATASRRVGGYLRGEDVREYADPAHCHLLDRPSVVGLAICGRLVRRRLVTVSHPPGDLEAETCPECERPRCPDCRARVPEMLAIAEAARELSSWTSERRR